MIEGYSAITQSLLGALFTWFLTAAGAALVFILRGDQRKILDASLGFAAGVMLAASYWSLLAPALELSSQQQGTSAAAACVPVVIGFVLGAVFVYGTDVLLPYINPHTSGSSSSSIKRDEDVKQLDNGYDKNDLGLYNATTTTHHQTYEHANGLYDPVPGGRGSVGERGDGGGGLTYRRGVAPGPPAGTESYQIDESNGAGPLGGPHTFTASHNNNILTNDSASAAIPTPRRLSDTWRRILLLIIAVTVHNIPEGLAVGVGFGAIGKTSSATFQNARNLAIGIGIQNFPEGLAVSLPLMGAGYSRMRSFWYGQLSGMVEPAAALLGAIAVTIAEPLLPYALSFAAGAMVYVVIDDIIPECTASLQGSNKLSSASAIVGFVVMMVLDTTLG